MECVYCKTKLETENQICCTFCGADLNSLNRPQIKEYVDVTDVLKPLKEKMTYHTYNLLEMLKIARKERTDAYNMLRIVLKSENEREDVKVEYEVKAGVESQYRLFTAHVNMIQEILIDRIGYYPSRVDNKLLDKYYMKCTTIKPRKPKG